MITTERERVAAVGRFIGRRPAKRFYFNVAPRYIGGSPALVPFHTALRCALQEASSYLHAVDGRYGEDEKKKADREGMKGIVECHHEVRKGWEVLDLLTGERFVRPFPKHA
jgi:hypothetical protein